MTDKLKKENLNLEQKYQHLVENSLQGVVIIQNFKIVYSNPAFAKITGYTIDELYSLSQEDLTNLVHPDDQKRVWENFRKRIDGHDLPPHNKFKGMTKDGKLKVLDLYASIIDYEGKPATQGLMIDITEPYEAEEKLKQRTKLIETIVNNISLGIAVQDISTSNYSFTNKEVKDIFGLDETDVLDIDKLLGKIKPTSDPRIKLPVKGKPNMSDRKQSNLIWDNIEINLKTGEKKYISAKKIPLYEQNLILFTAQDTTEQLKTEKFLKNSLIEKEILLREIHHRVKNNLQTISSLLDLQAESITDKKSLEAFRSSQSRIKSMALIHERLYKSEDLSMINAEDYISKLIDYLEDTYFSPTLNIDIQTDIKFLFLNLDVAIPCGLIINELISNSIKYAFGKKRKGIISVSLKPDDLKNLVLEIKDNGKGIPLALHTLNSQTLGLQLVKLLVKQLNGSMEIDGTKGTTVRIVFPKPKMTGNIDNQ